MITLNEAHNLRKVLESIDGWAQEVFIVDSFSVDDTVDIALEYGVNIVQKKFKDFGSQWNFALENLPIKSKWTMKLDPDERLTEQLKASLNVLINDDIDGIVIERRLWFMGKILPIKQSLLRVWRTGTCRFSNVAVNEHPNVSGKRILSAKGVLEHHDSPNLDHWVFKQNKYTTMEAASQFMQKDMAALPLFWRGGLNRRMWFKKYFWRIPFRYFLLYLYHYFWLGAWRAGRIGGIWAHLRVEVYRMWEYKFLEMSQRGELFDAIPSFPGEPDARIQLFK
jgi:glycosyltransferase involved in cell wall biosynthesis